jgi:hypothetical protein
MARRLTLEAFGRRLRELPADLERATIRGEHRAAERLEWLVIEAIGDTRPYVPHDTGQLTRSVRTEKNADGAEVVVDAPHAPFVEYGTRPHRPPLQPLIAWAVRKGFASTEEEAYPIAMGIARKIERRGTDPRHFMARAMKEFIRRGILQDEIRAELEDIR